ncbi:hypothetical protein GH733_011371 [Mirounga leonina]|nr:hypothetical protein GH733_011371 [Mirounga leonina]
MSGRLLFGPVAVQALADGSSRLRESEGLQEQKENPHATSNSIFINWKEHANDQQHIQVYENGGSQPNVSSQFRLRIKHCTILSNNVDHLLLNLTLSDIMVSLANASTLQKDSNWIEMIRKFVTETLEDGFRLNSKQLNRLLGVSWRLMQIQPNREATESLIKAVYTLYQQRGLLLPVRTLLLKFFSKIYQKEELRSYRVRYRSKVLSRWLAGLPLQLAHLGSRNPELSTQLIDIIHTAAARANRELLKSLQASALRIYDPQEGTVVVLPAESQQRLVQLVYFLPSLPADLLSRLSRCCIMGRLSSSLAAMLIGILHMRSSFSGWKYSVKDWLMSDVDYFSFLFSTLTGFSKEELTWLQNLRGVPHVIQAQLSPVLLYLTDLDQFLHHWDVTETVCHSLLVIPARSQSFDILQSAISKHLVGLTVIPDSTAGCVLGVICKLLDHTCVLSETLLPFLASCCYSLLYFLLTLEKGEAEHLRKRDKLWGVCVSILALLPRVLRLMLQSLRVNRAGPEELPVVGQLLRLLLQHAPLRTHMLTNAILVQQIIKNITTLKSGGIQEQWLTDLHYCFNVYITGHPQGPSALSTFLPPNLEQQCQALLVPSVHISGSKLHLQKTSESVSRRQDGSRAQSNSLCSAILKENSTPGLLGALRCPVIPFSPGLTALLMVQPILTTCWRRADRKATYKCSGEEHEACFRHRDLDHSKQYLYRECMGKALESELRVPDLYH